MPNDSLDDVLKNDGLAVPENDKTNAIIQNHGVVVGNIVLAGLNVRHKLLPHRFLLEGFVVEDYFLNTKDFLVFTPNIYYKKFDVNDNHSWKHFCTKGKDYVAINSIIYSKLVVDGKKKRFSNYFENEKEFTYRDNSKASLSNIWRVDDGSYYRHRMNGNIKFDYLEFEYYLYENTTSSLPECAANKIFALCKYYEDGELRYAIFNLHEIVPE